MSIKTKPASRGTRKYAGKPGRMQVAEILLSEDTPFHAREAYKALRTNVMFSIAGDNGKVIGVTSAVPGEGKSTTVMNLAITFAEIGNRVILLDGDLRRPNIQRITGAESGPGLAEVLARFVDVEDVVKESVYKNLDILYSGVMPPNPVELLGSKNMEALVDRLKERYDYIFIDTPPVNVVTDATVLSRLLDGLILVTRENSSKRDELLYAVNRLQFVNAKLIGIVLNDKAFHVKSSYRYGKYKSYYARDYGTNERD
ncbi:MAG: CpsD/CapB family tyrosine-protein kinase [Eubacteriales bacterium]|nr:CpsD/CapB family tyrosine-protein kinase [Eubacteriales bacterium]